MCPKQLHKYGLCLLQQGDPISAVDIAAPAVLEHPDCGALWELLGVTRHHLREYDAAVAALECASLLKPLDHSARFYLASSYEGIGKPELATFLYRLISESGCPPLWLLPMIASRLGQLGQDEQALDVCRTILRRDENHHGAHFGSGFYLRRLGASCEAIAAAVGRAHELAPEIELYRITLAFLWQELGRTDDAYELLKGVPPENVSCEVSLRNMRQVFRGAGDRDRAALCDQRLDEVQDELS